jgi:TolB-like protein
MRTFSATAVSAVVFTVFGATAKAQVPVLVMPFADSSGGGGAHWVQSSIQQSLVGDVARGGTFKSVAAPSTGNASDDLAVAISAARQANAPYVVFGSYQLKNGKLDVVANAIDVDKMQLVGGVQVRRPTGDIFGATDALGAHVVGQLNQARGGAANQANVPLGAAGPINRMQMPLASLPMSYVDWTGQTRRTSVHDRPSQFARLFPGRVVVDHPLEDIPNRLTGTSRDPRAPYSNGMQGGDGNQVTRSDGNAGPFVYDEITRGDGNYVNRGDGNSLKFNRTGELPNNRDGGFGSTMQFNRGPRDTRVNRDAGTGVGNSVNAPAASAARPNSGSAVTPGTGNAVRPNSGNAVTPAPRNGSAR